MNFTVVVRMALVSSRTTLRHLATHPSIFLGTYAGSDGSRKPTDLELKLATHQGTHFAQVATALKIGRAALPAKDASPPDPKQK